MPTARLGEAHVNQNVGGTDRTVRLVLGSPLVVVGVAGYAGLVRLAVGPLPPALTAVLLALVGLVLLGTGVPRVCVINRLLGVDTSGR